MTLNAGIGFRALAALLLAGIAGSACADSMDAEIDFLIESVARSDCTFIRNGREHDAGAASEHLQMKRDRGKRHYRTTEEFIRRIASRSSWTGRDYLIHCGNEEPVSAAGWFFSKLEEFRGQSGR